MMYKSLSIFRVQEKNKKNHLNVNWIIMKCFFACVCGITRGQSGKEIDELRKRVPNVVTIDFEKIDTYSSGLGVVDCPDPDRNEYMRQY